ncbi:hypothetical protein [Micromonospora sp. b486]|uniref:hypothetical protein n=1 Tax=Micromonospora sp. b486 TaxID=3053986 RepID=UPI00338F61D5
MRRLGMAVFGSVIAAAVVLGGVGAYGQLTSNSAPLEPNTLVIEREPARRTTSARTGCCARRSTTRRRG